MLVARNRRLATAATLLCCVFLVTWYFSTPNKNSEEYTYKPSPTQLKLSETNNRAQLEAAPATPIPDSDFDNQSRRNNAGETISREKSNGELNHNNQVIQLEFGAVEENAHQKLRSLQKNQDHTRASAHGDTQKTDDDQPQSKSSEITAANSDKSSSKEVALDRNLIISGRVMSVDGLPLGDIQLVATARQLFGLHEGQITPVQDLRRRVFSDSSGRYTFAGLADGEYSISTIPTAVFPTVQIAVRAGVDFADLVLIGQRKIRVFGQVKDKDGQLIEGALVTPTVSGERGTYSDGAGGYELDLLLRDDSRGFAIRSQHIDFRESLIHLSEQELKQGYIALPITMESISALAVVFGFVKDVNGYPIPGSRINLQSRSMRQSYRATAGQDGQFALVGVEIGNDYELSVSGSKNHQDLMQNELEITQDGLELALVLESGVNSTVYGQMLNSDGIPISNFSMIVRKRTPPYHTTQVTSAADGSYLLENAPIGELVFETRSYPRFMVSGVVAKSGGHHQIPLVLDWGSNELNGVVIDSSGNPISAPNVRLAWTEVSHGLTSRAHRRAAADAQGYFSFSGLGPGPHRIIVDALGYKQAHVDHDVTTQGYDLVVELEH